MTSPAVPADAPAPSSPAPPAPKSEPSRSAGPLALAEPIARNALRYSMSSREYATLHKYIISRSRLLRRAAPSVGAVERIIDGERAHSARKESREGRVVGAGDDYNTRAIRHAIRVFLATGSLMKLYTVVTHKLGKGEEPTSTKKQPFHKSETLRLSLSLSTILLLYRLLFRFLTRLRTHLLAVSAEPFRARNPRTSAALTSPYAPAVGASLAGLMLGVYPAKHLRVAIAVFAIFRAMEFSWNMSEDGGLVWGYKPGGKVKRERPWWFGSWMLQPFALGQLIHAVVFDRDCFPKPIGDFIFGHSPGYLHPKPANYPAHIKWPGVYDVVDSLGQMARLNWPSYISPTLFPDKETLPPTLTPIAPLTSTAHPLINALSCATLHPSDPSCLRAYLTFWIRAFPPLARTFLLLYSALALPRLGHLYHAPLATLNGLLARALRSSTFVAGSISTSWSAICLSQALLPKHILATQRFFVGGFLGGLWAFVGRKDGRSSFLYTTRASVDSLWKVGVKRRWWRGMKGGDVWVFVLALMATGVVYERDRKAIREGNWRKGVSWVRGEGFRDWGAEEDEEEEDVDEEGRVVDSRNLER